MSKYLQIQIPKACHENWDKMDDSMHGKFCNSCQKNVIDFTLMSDDDLARFFKKNKENVCGRFTSDQLNVDIRIPGKKIPWLKYFFTITIPAFLFSQKTNAQIGKIAVVEKHAVDKKRVKSQFSIKETEVTSDVKTLPQTTSSLENDNQLKCTRIMLGGAVGGIVIRQKKYYSFPFWNSIPNSFSVYPNPVSSFSRLNIKWKDAVATDQSIEIYNETGNLLQQQIINISKKIVQQSVELKHLPAGTYIIKITDSKTHRSSSQQFIVE